MDFSIFDIRKYQTLSVKDGYKEWVKTYEKTVQDEMDIDLLKRIKSINWTEIKMALDLACGTGRIGVWLKSQEVKNIDGIDITPEMLEIAKSKDVYKKLQIGNMLDTKFELEMYDLCTEVLADEHIPDLFPLYNEISRIMKQKGYFVIIGYHPHFLMSGIPTHFDRPTGESVAIKNYVHLFSDHIKSAYKNNLQLLEMEERIIDDDWVNKNPNLKKHYGRPISYMMVWQKVA